MQNSMLVPCQNISFLGVELNSINMRACLSEERTQKLTRSLSLQVRLSEDVQIRTPTYATALPLKSRRSQSTGDADTLQIQITCDCLKAMTPWSDMTLYLQDVLIGQVIRRKTYDRRIKHGLGSRMQCQMEKLWHINCLKLHAVHQALECFLLDILHCYILIRMDSMTVVAFINHQGG